MQSSKSSGKSGKGKSRKSVKKGKWTRQEEFFLRNAYGSTKDEDLATRLHRSVAAIQKPRP